MGTPEFAIPSLQNLVASRHDVLAVVTQPDRPKGRGQKLTLTPVKQKAWELGLDTLQPESLRDKNFSQSLNALKPDLFVVVAFSILPQEILMIPKLGSINLHPSLLPAYRGAAPIVWAIANGEKKTGLTTFLLNKEVDSGNILLQHDVPIHPEETSGTLQERLSILGADLITETINGIEKKSLNPKPQSDSGASYAPKLSKNDGRIEWMLSAETIHNRVRAFNPYPGAFTIYEDQPLRIHQTSIVKTQYEVPGQIIEAERGGRLIIACGKNSLSLLKLQPAGKKPMTSSAFLNGNSLCVGQILN